MPTNAPWLDDYQAHQQAELEARRLAEDEVFEIQNRVLRLIANCPISRPTADDCSFCPSYDECKSALEAQNKLFPEKYEEPVYRAPFANTHLVLQKQSAPSDEQDTGESPQPAPVLDLFTLCELREHEE